MFTDFSSGGAYVPSDVGGSVTIPIGNDGGGVTFGGDFGGSQPPPPGWTQQPPPYQSNQAGFGNLGGLGSLMPYLVIGLIAYVLIRK